MARSRGSGLNGGIIKFLNSMAKSAKSNGKDRYCMTIKRAVKSLRKHETEITNLEEAKSVKGIGAFLGSKIVKFLEEERGGPNPSQSNQENNDEGSKKKKKKKRKPRKKNLYSPRFGTGSFAILMVLYREGFLKNRNMSREDILDSCGKYTQTEMRRQAGDDYSGWDNCNKTLIKKHYFVSTKFEQRVKKYILTDRGIRCAKRIDKILRKGDGELVSSDDGEYDSDEERKLQEKEDEERKKKTKKKRKKKKKAPKKKERKKKAPKKKKKAKKVPPPSLVMKINLSDSGSDSDVEMLSSSTSLGTSTESDNDIEMEDKEDLSSSQSSNANNNEVIIIDIDDSDEDFDEKSKKKMKKRKRENDTDEEETKDRENKGLAQKKKRRKKKRNSNSSLNGTSPEARISIPLKKTKDLIHSCSYVNFDNKEVGMKDEASVEIAIEYIRFKIKIIFLEKVDINYSNKLKKISEGYTTNGQPNYQFFFWINDEFELLRSSDLKPYICQNLKIANLPTKKIINRGSIGDYFVNNVEKDEHPSIQLDGKSLIKHTPNNHNNNRRNSSVRNSSRKKKRRFTQPPTTNIFQTINLISDDEEEEDDDDEKEKRKIVRKKMEEDIDILEDDLFGILGNDEEEDREARFDPEDRILMNDFILDPQNSIQKFEPIKYLKSDEYEVICVLDNREKAHRSRTYFYEKLKKEVKCERAMLNMGDMLWIIRKRGESSGGYVCNYVVERKIVDDLASSLQDGRYHEQKSRIDRSEVENCFYLIEGNLKKNHLKRPESVLRGVVSRICAFSPKFHVQFTPGSSQTIMFLSRVTQFIENEIARNPNNIKNFLYKNDFVPLSVYNEENKKGGNLTVQEIFGRALLSINGCSKETALTTINEYQTPRLLYEKYMSLERRKKQEGLLRELKPKSRFENIEKRSIPPKFSKFVSEFFM